MGWLQTVFGTSPVTFEQDLELTVARWTDRSRKGRAALTVKQITEALIVKAEQLSRASQPQPPPPAKHRDIQS